MGVMEKKRFCPPAFCACVTFPDVNNNMQEVHSVHLKKKKNPCFLDARKYLLEVFRLNPCLVKRQGVGFISLDLYLCLLLCYINTKIKFICDQMCLILFLFCV